MARWNSHAYDGPTATTVRTAKRDLRCVTCRQWIRKGESYVCWRGKPGFPEHVDVCPPALQSEETYQVAGRGTIKVLRELPKDYSAHVGDLVRIDGEDWLLRGVEMGGYPADTVCVVVRRFEPNAAEGTQGTER